MVFRIMVLLAGGLALIPCNAEFRDPTQPAYPLPSIAANAVVDIELVLSAIWISPHSKRATINGISVKQGQTIVIEPISTESATVDDKKDKPPSRIQEPSAVNAQPPQTAPAPTVHSSTIKIISIHKNSVTIDQNGKRKTLHLVQRSYKIH
ncbi:MAG: hypothetical protein EPN17_17410 [Methylobacter sp.]|nr:MAG: hypothetical protein EPN17_17410 [Methylobacter sp.]